MQLKEILVQILLESCRVCKLQESFFFYSMVVIVMVLANVLKIQCLSTGNQINFQKQTMIIQMNSTKNGKRF